MSFSEVFPEFPGRRTYLALDIGLVDVLSVNDWSSQVYGLPEEVGDVADLNELNLGLQLIDQPVRAYGAASGLLDGKIKALFYRHKALAGYDYVSEFLIAPDDGATQTGPGDSGTVWHLSTTVEDGHGASRTVLRPMAVEWGGQTVIGSRDMRFNFALATGLSTVCQLLDVDLVTGHNTGANPYWGQVGHYSIATVAISLVSDPSLKAFLNANVERISFRPDELDAATIRRKLADGDFVELADVPDLVWKKVRADVPGGRDYARNAGPEHPNHYADIDLPGADGRTLRDLTLSDIANMDPAAWERWYRANGTTDARSEGLLPFRVWQFFDAMVAALQAGDVARFLCAAGTVSHYVGDACQPLHGSYLSDGRRNPADPGAKKWPGKGVHSDVRGQDGRPVRKGAAADDRARGAGVRRPDSAHRRWPGCRLRDRHPHGPVRGDPGAWRSGGHVHLARRRDVCAGRRWAVACVRGPDRAGHGCGRPLPRGDLGCGLRGSGHAAARPRGSDPRDDARGHLPGPDVRAVPDPGQDRGDPEAAGRRRQPCARRPQARPEREAPAMNRLILVRHGGSTANESKGFYAYNDSAICLTTNGIEQALNTAGALATVEPR